MKKSFLNAFPKTGKITTGPIKKRSTRIETRNEVTYFGWSGSGIECWVSGAYDGEVGFPAYSSKANFKGTGEFIMTMAKQAAIDYCNEDVCLVLKTDIWTWNDCNVRGYFYPE